MRNLLFCSANDKCIIIEFKKIDEIVYLDSEQIFLVCLKECRELLSHDWLDYETFYMRCPQDYIIFNYERYFYNEMPNLAMKLENENILKALEKLE